MNPKFTNIKKATIVVTESAGQYEFVCSEAVRGSGKNLYDLDIVGFGTSSPKPHAQYWIEFNGTKYGARFGKILESSGIFKVDFETIISDPEFWS